MPTWPIEQTTAHITGWGLDQASSELRRNHATHPVLTGFLVVFGDEPAGCRRRIPVEGRYEIVGHMSALQTDKIEVATAYGKMQLKRGDIIAINFPENGTIAAPGSPAAKDAALSIEESLHGTQYVNKTRTFTLTVPPDWKIDPKQPRSAPVVTFLSSHDGMG